MTPLLVIAAGGMIILTGIALLVRALFPPPPRLGEAMARLHALPRGATTGTPSPVDPGLRWLPTGGQALLARMSLGVAEADLAITGTSRTRHTLEKAAAALGGLLLPPLAALVLLAVGVHLPWTVPAVAGPILAALFWWSCDRDLASKAAARRAEFTAALTAYLALVGLERQVRGSPIEALEEAARLSGAWPFRLIHREVLRAELSGRPPWDGLRDLGARIGVERLQTLADIVASAADGAAVFATLMAEARTMRHKELADAQARANVVSEQLAQPVALLALAYMLLLLIPALLRIYQ